MNKAGIAIRASRWHRLNMIRNLNHVQLLNGKGVYVAFMAVDAHQHFGNSRVSEGVHFLGFAMIQLRYVARGSIILCLRLM